MNIKIKKNWDIKESSVTDEKLFLSRRNVIKTMATATMAGVLGANLLAAESSLKKLSAKKNNKYRLPKITEEKLTSYNNFYEFALDKQTVKTRAKRTSSPLVSGLVNKPLYTIF